MERHRVENYTNLSIAQLEAMPWALATQNRVSRNDIPEDFRGTTVMISGAYTKTVKDYGFGSSTVYTVS